MSLAKWCPEIVLCNSSNEKERDRRVKTGEKKAESGGGVGLVLILKCIRSVYCSEKKD